MRSTWIALSLFSLSSLAWGTDPKLLAVVSPDSKVIASVQVDQIKSSPFGSYVLAHFQPDDAAYLNFVQATGFDPRTDVSQMLLASNGENNTPNNQWLIAAEGNFDVPKITNALKAAGATLAPGTNIYTLSATGANGASQIAFTFVNNNSTALMGDVASVQAALQRLNSGQAPDATLLGKISAVSAKQFWFATLVPLSAFAAAMPNPNLQNALQGNMLQGITQAVGGLDFDATGATLDAQITARSDKDAQALADVIHFIAGMIQQNRTSNPAAGQVSAILDQLTVNSNGSTVAIHVPISETELESLLQTAQQSAAQTRPQVRRRSRVQ